MRIVTVIDPGESSTRGRTDINVDVDDNHQGLPDPRAPGYEFIMFRPVRTLPLRPESSPRRFDFLSFCLN